VEDNLRFKISAFIRADPCLRDSEGLKQDLSQKLQRMRVGCFARNFTEILKIPSHTPQEALGHHRLILEVRTLRDAPQSPVSRTTDTSSPPDEGNNIQTCEADAASPPNASRHHRLSGGHSTGIEIMSGNLRRRGAYPDLPVSRDFRSLDERPEVQKAMRDLVVAIRASRFFIYNELEPILGTSEATALMAVASEELWLGYGTKGASIYSIFIGVDGDEYECLWCGAVLRGKPLRAVGHFREKHLGHKPFPCGEVHVGDQVW